MSKRLRVVAYAVNGSGLGHLTRMVAILRWVRRLGQLAGVSCDIYILTSSEAPGLALQEGFATFKIPSKTSIRKSELPKEDYLRLARQWVWHSIGLLHPHLLLVDTFPAGSFGELFHALDGPKAKVFVFRSMKEEFAKQETIQAMLPVYDRILLPEEAGEERRKISSELLAKARYVGPIVMHEREELRVRSHARRRLGIPEEKLGVWLSAGGGGDPKAADALPVLIDALKDNPSIHLVVGAGPLYQGEPIRGKGITWLTDFHAMKDFLGLDFAISAAGYNSYHELLYAGVPSAFFAQEKIADEQSRRVNAALKAKSALKIESEESLPSRDSLQNALALLQEKSFRNTLSVAAKQFIAKNYAREAAFEILHTLLSKHSLEQSLSIGTPSFFLTMEQNHLSLKEVKEFFSYLGKEETIDPEDCRELFLFFLTRVNAIKLSPQLGLKLFSLYARRFVLPASIEEAELLVESGIDVLRALYAFNDERASFALLKLLPVERRLSYESVSKKLCEFLHTLKAQGESLWRGLAILGRYQGKLEEQRPFLHVIQSAIEEVTHGTKNT